MPAVCLPTSYKSNNAGFTNMPNIEHSPLLSPPSAPWLRTSSASSERTSTCSKVQLEASALKDPTSCKHLQAVFIHCQWTIFGPKYRQGALNKRSRSQVRTKACLLRIQFASTNRQRCCCNLQQDISERWCSSARTNFNWLIRFYFNSMVAVILLREPGYWIRVDT